MPKHPRLERLAPFLVALAAFLWATDSLFRVPALGELSPARLVFWEHAAALVPLAAWCLTKERHRLFKLSPGQWVSLAFIGAGASALATLLFTLAFRHANPTVVVLLQKTQPLIVITGARLILGENFPRGFLLWGSLAFGGAVLLSASGTFESGAFPKDWNDWRGKGAILSLVAASLWALATLAGRRVLQAVPVTVATFWRYAFGLAALALFLTTEGGDAFLPPENARLAILYMAWIPGLLAMLVYYAGLARTRAGSTALLELIFPVAAVLLNAWFLGAHLTPFQLVSGALLLLGVTRIALAEATGR